MGHRRYYDPEQRTCWPLDAPRADKKPTLDGATGNAAKDGYTALGPRRPRSMPAGDIMDADEAAMYDRFDEEDSIFFGGHY